MANSTLSIFLSWKCKSNLQLKIRSNKPDFITKPNLNLQFCDSGFILHSKVQVFWKGHKKFEKNLPLVLTLLSKCQKQKRRIFFSNFVAFSQYLNFNYHSNEQSEARIVHMMKLRAMDSFSNPGVWQFSFLNSWIPGHLELQLY